MQVAVAAMALVLSATLVPLTAAQTHEHEAAFGLRFISDLGPTGTTYVGALNHFTLVAFGTDAEPDFHQDLPVRVLLDGAVVLEVDAEAGHDYDGIRDTWVVFGRPGAYRVEALGEDGAVLAHLAGSVLEQPAFGYTVRGTGQSAVLVAPWEAEFSFHTENRSMARDFLAEVRDGARLAYSAPLRGPQGTVRFLAAPQGQGTYSASAVHYDAMPAAVAVPVPGGLLASDGILTLAGGNVPFGQPPGTRAPPSEANAVLSSPEGPMRLVATFDPWTQVGPDTLLKVGLLALDPQGRAFTNVSIASRVTDPLGRLLWESDAGFAPAGAWSFMSVQSNPGVYTLWVEATATPEATPEAGREPVTVSLDIPWTVLPPILPDSAGSISVDVAGLQGLIQGVAANITFTARDTAGTPFSHAEILVDVLGPVPFGRETGEDGLLLRTKLHAHADGTFGLTWAPPTHGRITFLVTPSPLEARAVTLGGHTFEVDAAPGEAPQPASTHSPTPNPSPALPLGLLLLAIGLAARRSRRA